MLPSLGRWCQRHTGCAQWLEDSNDGARGLETRGLQQRAGGLSRTEGRCVQGSSSPGAEDKARRLQPAAGPIESSASHHRADAQVANAVIMQGALTRC